MNARITILGALAPFFAPALALALVLWGTKAQAQHAPAYHVLNDSLHGSQVYAASEYISFLKGAHAKASDTDDLHAYIYKNAQDYALASYQDYIDPETTPINKDLPVGTLPGSFHVSQTGSANYTIPLELPPTPSGFLPSFSMSYNSSGGSSTLGWSWQLNGFSSISRTRRNQYYDQTNGGITFTNDDAIAMNGQRLIHINGVANGTTGAIYATEHENYMRVEKTDEGYLATTKDGTVMEFGYTPDARQLKAANESEELAWLLNKVSDIHGNYYTIHYKDFGNGEVLPEYVSYTANTAEQITAKHQIRFSYMERRDATEQYISGQLIKQSKLLHKIRVLTNGATYRLYHLNYFYDKYSKLNQISMEGVGGIRYNPTIIGWQNTIHEPYYYQTFQQNFGKGLPIKGQRLSFADYNADGRADMMAFPTYTQSNQRWTISYNTLKNRFDSNYTAPYYTYLPENYHELPFDIDSLPEKQWFSGMVAPDFRGVGTSDFLGMSGVEDVDYVNFVQILPTTIPNTYHYFPDSAEVLTGDFDGNNQSDILTIYKEEKQIDYEVFRDVVGANVTFYKGEQTESFIAPIFTGLPGMKADYRVGDVTGNGLTNIMLITRVKMYVFEWDSTTNNFEQLWSQGFETGANHISDRLITGDFNGDGLTDFIELEVDDVFSSFLELDYEKTFPFHTRGTYQGYQLFISTGKAFVKSPKKPFDFQTTPNDTIFLDNLTVFDMDADGRTDVIQQVLSETEDLSTHGAESYHTYMHFNLPYGQRMEANYTPPGLGPHDRTRDFIPYIIASRLNLNDFDGDGLQDLISSYYGDVFYPHTEKAVHVVTHIRNGMDLLTEVVYENNTVAEMLAEDENDLYSGPQNFARSISKVVKEIRFPEVYDFPTKQFKYGSGIYNKYHGFLGYKTFDSFDALDSILTKQEYFYTHQYAYDHVRTVRPKFTTTYRMRPDSTLLKLTEEKLHYGNLRYLPHKRYTLDVSSKETENFVLNTSSISRYQYDEHDNLSRIITEIPLKEGGIAYSEQHMSYTTLGQLTWKTALESTLTKKHVPGSDTVYEAQHMQYQNHLLKQQTVQATTSQAITTTYHYHPGTSLLSHTSSHTNDVQPDGSPYATRVSSQNTYDEDKRFVVTQTNALGHATQNEWDPLLGLPLKSTNALDQTTHYTYDGFGVLLSTTDHRNNRVTQKTRWYTGSAYPEAVYYTETKGAGIPTQRSFVDALGRTFLTETVSMNDRLIKQRIDFTDAGKVEAAYLPYSGNDPGLAVRMDYDQLGRLVTKTYAFGLKETYDHIHTSLKNEVVIAYDTSSFNQLNPDGGGASFDQQRRLFTNNLGKLIKLLNTHNQPTEYEYNSFGQPGNIINYGNTLSIAYDSLGRQTQMNDPNMNTIHYAYNSFGELKTHTNPEGVVTEVYYDAHGRVSKRVIQSSPQARTVYYRYDDAGNGLGRPREISDSLHSRLVYHYNDEGQVSAMDQWIADEVYTTQMAYNDLGQLSGYTYPSGLTVYYAYDAHGYLMSMTDVATGQVLWELQEADDFGNITQYQYGNGVQTTVSYDQFGGLRGIHAGGMFHERYAFQYGLGNLIMREDERNNHKEVFTYDRLNRLKGVKKNTQSVLQLAYDENGNITFKSDVGQYHYSQPGQGAPHAVKNITVTSADYPGMRKQRIHYNAQQNPDSITEYYTNGDTMHLTYDYQVNDARQTARWSKNGELIREKHYLDGYEVVTQGDSTKAYHYLTAPSGLVGVYVSNEDGSEGKLYYVHQDYLGSVRALSNETGELIQELSYDAWGRPRRADNHAYADLETPVLDRGYTLHEHLTEFGLIHMNGRLYDPAVGRMLSVDNEVQEPGNDQNFNRYSYVMNNPLKYTDPTGENFEGTHGGNSEESAGANFDGLILSPKLMATLQGRARELGFMIQFPRSTFVAYFDQNGKRYGGLGYVNDEGGVTVPGPGPLRVGDKLHHFSIEFFENTDGLTFERSLGHTQTEMEGSTAATKVYEYSTQIIVRESADDLFTEAEDAFKTMLEVGSGVTNTGKLVATQTIESLEKSKYRVRGQNIPSQVSKMKKIAEKISNIGYGITIANLAYSAFNSYRGNARNGSFAYDVGLVVVGTIPYVGVPLAITGSIYKDEVMDAIEEGAPAPVESNHHNRCFVAGTPVWNGNAFTAIEQLQITDTVVSYNTSTQAYEQSVVSFTSNRTTAKIYEVITSVDTFFVTGEHPFFVETQEWVAAKYLQPGDALKNQSQSDIYVINKTLLSDSVQVFNIEVNGNHNFIVGQAKILVHNKTRQGKLVNSNELKLSK